jgi:hypothetical protein
MNETNALLDTLRNSADPEVVSSAAREFGEIRLSSVSGSAPVGFPFSLLVFDIDPELQSFIHSEFQAHLLGAPEGLLNAPELTSLREHQRAIVLVDVLVEPEPRRDTGEQAGERGLAHRERFAPQVLPVELDQVLLLAAPAVPATYRASGFVPWH